MPRPPSCPLSSHPSSRPSSRPFSHSCPDERDVPCEKPWRGTASTCHPLSPPSSSLRPVFPQDCFQQLIGIVEFGAAPRRLVPSRAAFHEPSSCVEPRHQRCRQRRSSPPHHHHREPPRPSMAWYCSEVRSSHLSVELSL